MLLVIDVGNTNMEFGIWEDKELIGVFRLGTKRDITSDEVGLFTMQYFNIKGLSPSMVEKVVLSSVVPQVNYSISAAVQKYFGEKPLIVGEDIFCPITNLYANPAEVGADRLVDAWSAYKKYGGPLIIVDFGTATTCEAVNEKGEYLGGTIFPGIKVSLEALFEKAAKLPRIELTDPGVAIGRSTVESMQAGAVLGYAGAIEKTVSHIKAELSENAKTVATGGLSRLFAGVSPIFDIVDATLPLEGMRMLYEEYKNA